MNNKDIEWASKQIEKALDNNCKDLSREGCKLFAEEYIPMTMALSMAIGHERALKVFNAFLDNEDMFIAIRCIFITGYMDGINKQIEK